MTYLFLFFFKQSVASCPVHYCPPPQSRSSVSIVLPWSDISTVDFTLLTSRHITAHSWDVCFSTALHLLVQHCTAKITLSILESAACFTFQRHVDGGGCWRTRLTSSWSFGGSAMLNCPWIVRSGCVWKGVWHRCWIRLEENHLSPEKHRTNEHVEGWCHKCPHNPANRSQSQSSCRIWIYPETQETVLPRKNLLIMSACMLFSHTRCGVSFTSLAGLSAAGRF